MKNNSKKYRLIREYPGSPKLGTIIEWRVSLGGYWAYKRSDYKSVPNWKSIQLTEPKNHPEYWEEVVEKDYEILSVISSGKSNVYSKGEKILYNKDYKFKEMYSDQFWDIHSVKRLSSS